MGMTLLARAALVLALAAVSTSARAGECKPVHGFYTSTPVPANDCASVVGLCTAGELIGGIQGTYRFTATGFVPSGDPQVTFYTGESVVSPKLGGTVTARDYGTIQLPAPNVTGRQAALLIITGGVDRWAGASGYLQLVGSLDAEFHVQGEYFGQICTP